MPIETLTGCNSQDKPGTNFSFSATPMKKKYLVGEPKVALAPLTGKASVGGGSRSPQPTRPR